MCSETYTHLRKKRNDDERGSERVRRTETINAERLSNSDWPSKRSFWQREASRTDDIWKEYASRAGAGERKIQSKIFYCNDTLKWYDKL